MDDAALDDFIDQAKELARRRNATATTSFGLGAHARYELDLAASRILFFDQSGTSVLEARAVPIGSWSERSASWMWSWENESVPHAVSDPMRAVEAFGREEDIGALQHMFQPCDEALAWALAAISLKLLDAAAIYRVKQAKSVMFLLLFDMEPLR